MNNEKLLLEERIVMLQRKTAEEVSTHIIAVLSKCTTLWILISCGSSWLQKVVLEKNFELEREAMKLQISEFERKLEEMYTLYNYNPCHEGFKITPGKKSFQIHHAPKLNV